MKPVNLPGKYKWFMIQSELHNLLDISTDFLAIKVGIRIISTLK